MKRKIPIINQQNRILILCEGQEEYKYIERLKSRNVWSHKLTIDIKNVKSIDNLMPHYEYYFQNGNYKVILIYCDTEVAPYSQYEALIKRIDEFHNTNKISNDIVYFVNPCTMQIILSHFQKVSLVNNSKKANAALISKLTGVADYAATEKQCDSIMRKINEQNYQIMKNNMSGVSSNYKTTPSSNVLSLFDNLESDSIKWIAKIIKKINCQ